MQRTKLDRDIKPVSEFRANAAELIDQLRVNRRPLVLTQRGHSAAVLLDVEDFEEMVEELELLRDVRPNLPAEGLSASDRRAVRQALTAAC